MATSDGSAEAPQELGLTGATVTRAAWWMAAAQVGGQGTSLVCLVALGTILPPRAFGTVTAGIVLLTVATLLMGAGTSGSLLAGRSIGAGEVRGAFILNVSIGAVLTGAIWFLAGPMARTFATGSDPAVLQGLGSCLVLYSLAIVPGALLQKRMQFKRYALAVGTATTLSWLGAVLAALAGAGVWALVLRQVFYYAILAALTGWMARNLFTPMPEPSASDAGGTAGRRGGGWFFILSAADFVAFNADYLVVGRLAGTSLLGTYSLAFTLAFTPLRQFAWQVGSVLFAASAALEDPQQIGRGVVRALRMTAVLLLPILPPAITLAPWVLPDLLGDQWTGIVAPFQILLVVGVGHAMVNVIGEFLSGTGNVAFRARTSVVWAIGMVVSLMVLVSSDGIRGAAVAHAILFLPLAAAYAFWGGRRLGVTLTRLATSLDDIVLAVCAQATATALLTAGLGRAGLGPRLSSAIGAACGLALVAVLLLRTGDRALSDAFALVGNRLGGARRR